MVRVRVRVRVRVIVRVRVRVRARELRRLYCRRPTCEIEARFEPC